MATRGDWKPRSAFTTLPENDHVALSQEFRMNHIIVALSVEAVGAFSIAGAITAWTRSVLRATAR